MISTYLKTGAKTLWNFAVLPLLVWAAWYTKHPIFPFALGFLYIISVFSFALICFGFWKALDADLHIPDDGGGGGGTFAKLRETQSRIKLGISVAINFVAIFVLVDMGSWFVASVAAVFLMLLALMLAFIHLFDDRRKVAAELEEEIARKQAEFDALNPN